MSFDPDEFPQLPLIENPEEIEINKEIFKNMIRQTLFSVSTDETRPILTGALLEISEDRMSMVAIDGYRLAMKSIDHEGGASSKTVIPGKTLSELLKILSATAGEAMLISITDKYIAFEINHIKIISKILEGEFIKYEQIIPSDFKTQLTINTVELLQAIERASLMTRESKSGTVKISFDSEYVEVSSISEIGSVSDKVRVKTEGDIFEIGFNPRYLTEALRVIDAEKVLIKMSSSLSPCIIKPSENDQYTYLVLPVRMSN
jgi:DNA polymerase-3 subunit beta